jgi:hypothetical protein
MPDEPRGPYGPPHPDVTADVPFLAAADALTRALRAGQPSALRDAIARHPEYAVALADYALYFRTMEAALPPLEANTAPAAALAPAAQRAFGRMAATPPAIAGILATARQVGMDAAALAARIRLSADVLAKLDSGAIDPATVPALLIDRLVQTLQCGRAAIRAYLQGVSGASAAPAAGGALHARERPVAPGYGQESFAQAVRTSVLLSAEERAEWLQVIAEGA